MPRFDIEILEPFQFLIDTPAPFKGLYGGRGGAKSFAMADAILIDSFRDRHRIACLREIQASIKESTHALLKARIGEHGMGDYFKVTETSIVNRNTGSDFFFKGLKTSSAEIKSTYGITRALVEEAEPVSAKSWEILLPTVRTAGAEIWAAWNPVEESNATDKLWRKNPPTGAIVKYVTWRDNPYFPANLNQQRLDMLRDDPVLYEHIWEGGYRKISEAVIFKNRVEIHDFPDAPRGTRFYFGADFGFSQDPSTLIRMYITVNEDGSEELWIDREAWGAPELDEMAAFYDAIEGSRQWPIKGDNSRPETISFLSARGFMIDAAKKWAGSIEDGITHLKSFKVIHIHKTLCPNMAREARSYCYKIDKQGNILPIPVDKDNHGWDAVRYGLDDFISDRGGIAIWEKLGSQ